MANTHDWRSRYRAGLAGSRGRAVSQRAIKPEVYLRAAITKGCRPRNVYLTHPGCVAALEAWITIRLRRRWALSGTDEYQGLRPNSKLVTTHKGHAFELAFKHRELEGDQRCTGLVIRCSRPSAGFTGRQVSSWDLLKAAGAPWRPRCWRQQEMLRRCRLFLAIPVLITASLIWPLTKRRSGMHSRLHWHSDISSVHWIHLCTGIAPCPPPAVEREAHAVGGAQSTAPRIEQVKCSNAHQGHDRPAMCHNARSSKAGSLLD